MRLGAGILGLLLALALALPARAADKVGVRAAEHDSEGFGRIAFDWFGTGIVAQLARPPDDPGRVRFWIDGAPSLTLDASTLVKRNIVVVAEGLARGRHQIAVERLDPPSGADGDNVRFGLAELGAIGVRSS